MFGKIFVYICSQQGTILQMQLADQFALDEQHCFFICSQQGTILQMQLADQFALDEQH
jgi:hypothetical protein